MKSMKSPPILFAFVCGALLCAAQTGSPPAGEPATPDAKVAPVEKTVPPADKYEGSDETVQPATAQPKPPAEPVVAPAAQPTVNTPPEPTAAPATTPPVDDSALPPRKKPAAEAKGEPDPTIKPYIIGPLDVLSVSVWGQANMSGLRDVSPDGTISMPLIKVVKADGLTVAQLEDVITQRLSECCLNDPEVTISVVKINSKSVLLIGGVGHPGKFLLTEPKTTVLDAIVGSGGLRELSNGKKIYILRGGKKIKFNYKEVIQGKHTEQNIELQNGDQIVVPE